MLGKELYELGFEMRPICKAWGGPSCFCCNQFCGVKLTISFLAVQSSKRNQLCKEVPILPQFFRFTFFNITPLFKVKILQISIIVCSISFLFPRHQYLEELLREQLCGNFSWKTKKQGSFGYCMLKQLNCHAGRDFTRIKACMLQN